MGQAAPVLAAIIAVILLAIILLSLFIVPPVGFALFFLLAIFSIIAGVALLISYIISRINIGSAFIPVDNRSPVEAVENLKVFMARRGREVKSITQGYIRVHGMGHVFTVFADDQLKAVRLHANITWMWALLIVILLYLGIIIGLVAALLLYSKYSETREEIMAAIRGYTVSQ